jgi:hypothetical protein
MHVAIEKYIGAHSFEKSGPPMEVFAVDMSQASGPHELRTAVLYPIK